LSWFGQIFPGKSSHGSILRDMELYHLDNHHPFLVYILARTCVMIDPLLILESVLLYLALPLMAGILTRRVLSNKPYFSKVLNIPGNVQTIALLFTVLVIFWSEGYGILEYPLSIWMIAVIMLTFYFLFSI